MSLLRNLASGLRGLFRREQIDRELNQELNTFLEMAVEEKVKQGMSHKDAVRAVRVERGSLDGAKEEVRSAGWETFVETCWQDLCFGARMLRKNPGFTAVAMLSLALGIGAATSVFSLVNAILLRSLPVPNPQELRVLRWTGVDVRMTSLAEMPVTNGKRVTAHSFSYPAFLSLRERCRSLAEIFGFQPIQDVTARVADQSFTAKGMMVTDNFFSALSISPLFGRVLEGQEDYAGSANSVVLSYDWWQLHFAGDSRAIGQVVILDGNPFMVVGILPHGFSGVVPGESDDFYVAMVAHSQFLFRPISESFHWFVRPMARLHSGVRNAQLQSALNAIFAPEASAIMHEPTVLVEPGHAGLEMDRDNYRKPLLLLLAVVALVLLVACANVAGLSLARGSVRQHELAVRAALGAERTRLIRQSLTESLVLALLSGVIGVMLATWGKTAVSHLLSGSPDGLHYDISLDFTVLGFALAATFITAMLFGLLPALRAGRTDPLGGLKSGGGAGLPRLQIGKVLVVGQIYLSLLLLTAAGLYIQTLVNLTHIKAGFRTENLLLFEVNPAGANYDGARRISLYERIQSSLTTLPGVAGASLVEFPLLDNRDSWGGFSLSSRPPSSPEELQTHRLTVGETFFDTMGIPITEGRGFSTADSADAPKVIVVNQTFVRRYLSNQDPMGRLIGVWGADWRIVGVCRDAKLHNIKEAVPPIAYFPFRQRLYGPFRETHLRNAYFVLRTNLFPLSLVDSARRAVAAIDPGVPVANVSTQQALLGQTISQERLFAALCSSLAVLALLLCCIGLYGLMAHHVACRTREFAMRIALGASRRQIAVPILRESLVLAAISLAIGFPSVLVLSRLVENQLYGVAHNDPSTLGTAGAVLVLVALLAAYLPARRAMRVDPIAALRYE